jgi:hypothetical protein
MSESAAPNPQADADRSEAAADQAIAACGGDAREAVKALVVAKRVFVSASEAVTVSRIQWLCARQVRTSAARPQGLV